MPSSGYLLNLQISSPVINERLLYLQLKDNYLTLLAIEFIADRRGVGDYFVRDVE